MEKVAEVLAGLRNEEARLRVELAGVQRAIGALQEVLGIAPPAQPQPAAVTAPTPAAVPALPKPEPPGPYATHSLYEAVALYLAEAGEPRTAREIADALQAGGYPTQSRDFTATVPDCSVPRTRCSVPRTDFSVRRSHCCVRGARVWRKWAG
jgi:hypothetical protein